MFQYSAAKCYEPEGNNIFCTCFTEIDVGSSSSAAAVADTSKSTDEQGGLWWSWRSKANKKSAAKKKTTQKRRRITCPNAECGVSVMMLPTIVHCWV